MNIFYKFILLAFVFCRTLIFSGCTPNQNASLSNQVTSTSSTSSTTPTATVTGVPAGEKAVRILFSTTTYSGSFDPTNISNGTVPGDGSGIPAIKFFNPDGSSLTASSTTSSLGLPLWVSQVEVGVSGPSNTSATTPTCVTFAGASESSTSNCNLGGGALTATCGAPAGQLRVSEYDCVKVGTPPISGTGSGLDGLYIRVKFNRDITYLGAQENILAVIEYFASAVSPAPASPTSCFVGGKFKPENCSEYVWNTYLRITGTATSPLPSSPTQPFLLFIPPTNASVNYPGQSSPTKAGTTIATKQFILPLASNSAFTVFQMSRSSNFTDPSSSLNTACSSNSPLCSGVIFYSLTLYRI